MELWSETNWFAIQARPHRETLAAGSVTKLDAEVFLPRIKQEQRVCGTWRRVARPLFAGYFFARFRPVTSLDAIRYARGVLRVVGSASIPIPLDPEIISGIQDRVQADGFVHLQRTGFQPGESVSIQNGPLAGWIGQVERELDDGRRVAILLDAIHRARVLVEKRWLTREISAT